MGKANRNRTRRAEQGPKVRQADQPDTRSDRERMLDGDIGPMTYQGRVITPEVITEMREMDPEHAHQLDDEWERSVLQNNAPWLNDPQLLHDTETMFTELETGHSCPICNEADSR